MRVKLSEIGAFKNGLNFAAENVISGCKMVGIPDFEDNYIAKLEGLKEVNPDIVSDDYLLKNGDILFVRSNGNKNLVGRAMIVQNVTEKVTFSGFCIRFRILKENINPLYMLYLFKSPLFRKLFSNTQQTSISNLNQEVLGNIQLELPTMEVQNRIVNTIHGITRKIENNNKINDNLEQQAKLLYDYWFTQFDFPDENGKPYHSSSGKMVWNEQLKRYIPLGWEVKPIIELAHIYQPQTINNSLFDDNLPFNVYGGGGLIGKYKEYNHEHSEVILSCRGNCGNIFYTMPYSWITGNAMVIHPNEEIISKNYLYEFLKCYGVSKYISGSVQKQLTRENLSVMPIIVPPKTLIDKFNLSMTNIVNKKQLIILENRQLISLRDWLLPMLMNGQATITK